MNVICHPIESSCNNNNVILEFADAQGILGQLRVVPNIEGK
jgi:hypothetical protein